MENTSKKKIPLRRCIGCGERFEKPALVRVVRSPEGEITLDFVGKKPGRGAYLCRSVACLKKARKQKRLEQNLECAIPDTVYEALEGALSDSGV
ncbi:MAG: YlxR family protein [Clostridia bacterium]|nr:YlxR family protein [Clostridia bacterium]